MPHDDAGKENPPLRRARTSQEVTITMVLLAWLVLQVYRAEVGRSVWREDDLQSGTQSSHTHVSFYSEGLSAHPLALIQAQEAAFSGHFPLPQHLPMQGSA